MKNLYPTKGRQTESIGIASLQERIREELIKMKTKTFQDILAEKMGNAHLAAERTESIQEELTLAQRYQAEIDREVTRFNRIAYLARFTTNPMEWRRQDNDVEDKTTRTKWRYWHMLETSTLRLQVVVRERTDRSRDKFEVKATGWERELSVKHGDVQGGYVYEMDAEKHEWNFRSLKEAEDFAEMWRRNLYDKHKDAIDSDRLIRELYLQK